MLKKECLEAIIANASNIQQIYSDLNVLRTRNSIFSLVKALLEDSKTLFYSRHQLKTHLKSHLFRRNISTNKRIFLLETVESFWTYFYRLFDKVRTTLKKRRFVNAIRDEKKYQSSEIETEKINLNCEKEKNKNRNRE